MPTQPVARALEEFGKHYKRAQIHRGRISSTYLQGFRLREHAAMLPVSRVR